jgi:geranylgeranylglyceryl phosphate synthase family protein
MNAIQRSSHILGMLEAARESGRRMLGVLIDPDEAHLDSLSQRIAHAEDAAADLLLLGGSFLGGTATDAVAQQMRRTSTLPIVLFPGGPEQLTPEADAVLLLSLISGRNAELLIGQHVKAAPLLEQMSLEIIPTGYMLVDTGRTTTAAYISGTPPLPAHKPALAAYTALAGQMLGMRLIYIDAGSGALRPVPVELVQAVRQRVTIPIVVGGGIRVAEEAASLYDAGADMLVIGTALEEDAKHPLLGQLRELRQRVA